MLLYRVGRFQFASSRDQFRREAARPLVTSVDLPIVAALLDQGRLDAVRIFTQPDYAALERAPAGLENALR